MRWYRKVIRDVCIGFCGSREKCPKKKKVPNSAKRLLEKVEGEIKRMHLRRGKAWNDTWKTSL